MWSENNDGDKISIRGFWETKEESFFVSYEIEKLISYKTPLNEIAILFRVAAHTRSFEDRKRTVEATSLFLHKRFKGTRNL